jgi:hypothetical protein
MPILTPFAEVALLLVMASGIGLVGMLLRQPLIVSFIAVGLLAGPSVLDAVQSDAQITLLSELGIAVLLFLVGIKLDVKLIRSLGVVSVLTGPGPGRLYRVLWLSDRAGAGAGPCHQPLCRGGADVFLDHHHRQASVRQARDRRPSWPDRAGVPDRAGSGRGAGDDRAVGHRHRRGGCGPWRRVGDLGAAVGAGAVIQRW